MECKFREKVKELREEKELLQAELAVFLHVSKSAVSGWEVGRNQPNYETLLNIAKFFDVSTDYLLGYKDY
jgi:transcriptional regulator with XRE-family HTH domain